jgi:hypothetical protein
MAQQAKRDLAGTLDVNGVSFSWRLDREPQWSTTDGYRGLSIIVDRIDRPGRSLCIVYPFPRWKGFGTQGRKVQRPQVQPGDIADGIAEAIKQGYDPDRRGKPFLFQVKRSEA